MEKIISLENIGFSFNGKPVVKDANFSVAYGEFVGIIGPNGAGKTTLLKLMAGLLAPDEGRIELSGKNISEFSRKKIAGILGYVPQAVDLAFSFSVREVVMMGRFPHQHGLLHIDTDAGDKINSAMSWMNLQMLADRPFTNLSGGEKQRAIIASVLAQEAELLLLDEPTSALDLKHQQGIYRILKRLGEEDHKAIVLVTHDINLAAQFCDRLILMHNGCILKDGKPEDVLKFPIIQDVYGVKVYIDINPFTNSIYILPYETI